MTSGRPPFRAPKTLAVLKRVTEDTPRPIPEIIPETPRWLCDLIARLHAKKPSERVASARAVAEWLGRDAPLAPREVPRATPVRSRKGVWLAALAVIALLIAGLSVTEATGVTTVSGTVIRLFSPEGTLIVEVDDPAIGVTIDGSDVVLTGAGVKEIRLTPGPYTLKANKNGKTVWEQQVSVERYGKRLVQVRREQTPARDEPIKVEQPPTEWEKSVAAMPAEEQVKAVVARLQKLNLGFDGAVTPTTDNDIVVGLRFVTNEVKDVSPVRALKGLRMLYCGGTDAQGKLTDLSPLRGLPLTTLACNGTQVADLSPLAEMPLKILNCRNYLWQPKRDAALLRSLSELEVVNSDAVAKVLKKLDGEK